MTVIQMYVSDGAGRTGTYIALDYLLKQAETDGIVDVPACVNRLRESRICIVQTKVESVKFIGWLDIMCKLYTSYDVRLYINLTLNFFRISTGSYTKHYMKASPLAKALLFHTMNFFLNTKTTTSS